MAVSVRAACSMPHLHTLDFDYPSKNPYTSERWGNSNPVYILSLLEIVEQDNVHVQEAAPRLKPGWVRNACAAFEQGMAFPPSENKVNVTNVSYKIKRDVTEEKPASRPRPVSCKVCTEGKAGRVTLPKAKSLENLNQYGKLVKKEKVPLPQDNLNNVISSSPKLLQNDKRSINEINGRLKKLEAVQDQKLLKSLSVGRCPSSKRRIPTPQERKEPKKVESRVFLELRQGKEKCNENSFQPGELKRNQHLLEGTSTSLMPPPEDVQDIDIAKREVSSKVSPRASLFSSRSNKPAVSLGQVLNPAHHDDNIAVTDSHVVENYASSPVRADHCDPYELHNDCRVRLQNIHCHETLISSPDHTEDAITLGVQDSTNYSHVPMVEKDKLEQNVKCVESSTHFCQSQIKVTLEEQHAALPFKEVPVDRASLPKDNIRSEEPSVRPKVRIPLVHSVHQSKAQVDRSDGILRNCRFQGRYGPVAVSIRSSCRKNQSSPIVQSGEDEFESAKLSGAMCKSATDAQLQGALPNIAQHDSCHTFGDVRVVVGRRKRKQLEEGNDGVATLQPEKSHVRIADRLEFPTDKLAAFLLLKDTFKLGAPMRWRDLQAQFISSRQFSTSHPKFSNSHTLSLTEEEHKDLSNVCVDHIEGLKEALARKWSRPSYELQQRRSSRLSLAKLGSFRYELLTHPLVYFDCSETEDSGSESEEEAEGMTTTPFSFIPTYIIARIFSDLNTRDLAALKCCCTDFHWLINQYDITGTDALWNSGEGYRNDPCMHCGKIRDPRGDVSLCRRHPKMYYSYSHIGRRYWTCCNALDRGKIGCEVGLHNNRWNTTNFEPNFICKPWKSRAWYVTANHELWCDKEHL